MAAKLRVCYSNHRHAFIKSFFSGWHGSTQGFICADKEEAYEVSGDLILIPKGPSGRIRWSLTEGKLELIYELPVQGQLEPTIKYILLPK